MGKLFSICGLLNPLMRTLYGFYFVEFVFNCLFAIGVLIDGVLHGFESVYLQIEGSVAMM